MLPILMTRSALGPGDEATSQIRHAALPSGQRAEAIQKILDALGRHLSGKEVLSRDALVRLMEDLARILKFPPLPQESGRDFVKRLIGFLQSMPMPERLLLERQLGGRSLAHRIAVLTAMPSGLGERTSPTGVVGANAGFPQSQPKEAIRNLPVQTAAPPQFAAIKASASSEVALLQSVLKKTFGADEEGHPTETMFEEAPDEAPNDSRRPDAARTSDARTQRIPVSARPNMETAASVVGGGMPGEIAETDAALPQMQPEDEVGATGEDPAGTGSFPGEAERLDASPSESTLLVPEDAEQTGSDAEALLEGPEAADDDGLDADGTYGRPAPDSEGHATRPAGPRAEPGGQAARFSADAVKALVREGLAFPEVLDEGRKLAEPKDGETGDPMPAAPQESDAAEHSPLIRSRNEATGAAPLSDLRSADEPERTAALRSANQAKASNAGGDPTMQQMITRLVENGLPREAIPFALVPYPPAKTDAEDVTGKPDQQQWTGDGESDAGADAESDEGDRETPAKESSGGGAEETSDEPGAIDAYDLYRKLGGLG
ncbi:hypothetical protein [Sinorhizobium mexicanum]|uniref:Uncharacterized protein n=1 Tax=Sinorhizobium mexicanum TaxID=375549 RepID=A0A859QJY9_9HYPH|nr:hypothetical protein [Sinorhizobium mexicanum]MBP1887194.1 hypothetical protein [Sinorhizobium mexicanum]QLL60216.1 hypothetical protein FKV68_01540 [Sinorhizobium mexicanum]